MSDIDEIKVWHTHRYARGYKDGIGQAKEIVSDIISRYLRDGKQG